MPIVIGESDPEGCAACPVKTDPHNAYRNGTMYSSYTAEQIARTYELADLHKVNLMGSGDVGVRIRRSAVLLWLSRSCDQRASQAGAQRVPHARSNGRRTRERRQQRAVPLETVRDVGVRERADINAIASRQERAIAVLVWNYHDDDLPAPDTEVALRIAGVPVAKAKTDAVRRRSHAQQHLRGLEEDGVAATAIGATIRRARKGGRPS